MKVFKDGGLNAGTESVADSLGDEADMTLGPGNDGWNGQWSWDTCTPTQDNGGQCGYTAMSRVLDDSNVDNGRLKYANYGKGVQMWESDTQASQFMRYGKRATPQPVPRLPRPTSRSETWPQC
jgi:hypothetical protein